MKKIVCIFAIFVFCAFTITGSANEPFLSFEFQSSTHNAVYKGDVVECSVKFGDIQEPGLSSVELLFSYSEGLLFNNDCTGVGFCQDFELWEPNVDLQNRTVKIVAIDESVVTPCKSDFEIKFSFTVTAEELGVEHIKILKRIISDFDVVEREDIKESIFEEGFVVNVPRVENIGASLRVNNTPSLRFGARAEDSQNYEIKMLVCEGTLDELTCDTEGAQIYTLNKTGELLSTEPVEFTANSKEYTFRPFVTLPDGHVVYYEALTRSAEYVAKRELAVETDKKIRELLSTFCTNS